MNFTGVHEIQKHTFHFMSSNMRSQTRSPVFVLISLEFTQIRRLFLPCFQNKTRKFAVVFNATTSKNASQGKFSRVRGIESTEFISNINISIVPNIIIPIISNCCTLVQRRPKYFSKIDHSGECLGSLSFRRFIKFCNKSPILTTQSTIETDKL